MASDTGTLTKIEGDTKDIEDEATSVSLFWYYQNWWVISMIEYDENYFKTHKSQLPWVVVKVKDTHEPVSNLHQDLILL